MTINTPPLQNLVQGENSVNQVWARWFDGVFRALSGKEPIKLSSFTVANVPSPTENTACVIYISNESGGAVMAFSDGANWRRVTDRAIIS